MRCGQKKSERRLRKIKPVKPGSDYRRIWRIVDGAIRDCAKHHEDYFDPKKLRAARESLAKRITGALLAYEAEAKAKGPIQPKTGG